MTNYPGTHESFHGRFVREIREPVLQGAGHPVVSDAALRYRLVGNALMGAAEQLRGAGRSLSEAYEGTASEGARAHLHKLAALGDVAEAEAQLSHRALTDQAQHVAAVRSELAALPDPEMFAADPTMPVGIAPAHDEAARIATLYQDNTNVNLGTAFSPFQPPTAPQIGPTAALPGGGPGGGLSGGVTVPPTAAPSPGKSGSGGTAPHFPSPGTGTDPGAGPAAVPPAGPARPAPVPGTASPGGRPTPTPTVPQSRVPQQPGPAVPPPATRRPGLPDAAPPQAWQPGQPWTRRSEPLPTSPLPRPAPSRPGAPGVSGSPGRPGEGQSSTPRPGATPAGPGPAGPHGARPFGAGGMPLLPGAGGGRQDDSTHQRPAWLLEDDADGIWFAGLPHHVDPVIRGDR